MKIAVIGATGFVGSKVLAEALERGHMVTAIVRHNSKLAKAANLTARRGNIDDPEGLRTLLAGHDAVITAVRFLDTDARTLIDAIKRSRVGRWIIVGGAGSLEVAPGQALVDQASFPAEYKAEALAGREFLNLLRKEKEPAWTFFSPSAILYPGERTGKFRLGRDQLLSNEKGESKISVEDYAVALVDELEKPKHARQRFTVAY